ncbi:MAG: helix-turn-helix domain-containing protein [Planctomycetaceae bacterium]|nr:helix-turn-helix domain-containing protein [Planctomycetaceae bacterium]
MVQQRDLFSGEILPSMEARKRNGHARSNGRTRNDETLEELTEQITSLSQQVAAMQLRMERMESLVIELSDLVKARKTIKESYTTKEVADILGKKPYTVREWCRLQRVEAFKPMCGRGCEEEWRITHEELLRIQNEGLLPEPEHF